MSNSELFLQLTSELTKKNVQTKRIQQLCQQLKIPFNGDVVELMTFMLGSGIIPKNLKARRQANTRQTKKTNNDINI